MNFAADRLVPSGGERVQSVDVRAREDSAIDGYRQRDLDRNGIAVDLIFDDFRQIADA